MKLLGTKKREEPCSHRVRRSTANNLKQAKNVMPCSDDRALPTMKPKARIHQKRQVPMNP
eukprot:1456335-Amphidinium_carterae.1